VQACAYVVGSGEPAARLAALAQQLEFRVVLPFNAITDAEPRWNDPKLSFFLFAEAPRLAAHADAVAAIRQSPVTALKFSPLVYFCASPSLADISTCLGMGFDDIIAAPHSRERVGRRLQRQIGAELTYLATPGYFGPDRRGGAHSGTAGTERADHRHVAIFRDLATGIRVSGDGQQVVL
jgi:hypothetical protein